MKKYQGCAIVAVGLLLNLLESLYFGHWTVVNLFPKSPAEVVCDVVCAIIMLFGFARVSFDIKSYKP